VQVAFERAKFVTGFSRWVKGQGQNQNQVAFKLWVNNIRERVRGPRRDARVAALGERARVLRAVDGLAEELPAHHGVAVHAAFERQILKPVFYT
jgi:hypothetical protein